MASQHKRSMPSRTIEFLVAVLSLAMACSHASLWSAENVPGAEAADAERAKFGVYWPPQNPAAASAAKTRALLDGLITLKVQGVAATGWVASIRIILSRAPDEAGREFWNARLAFPEYDWMSYVRVWDTEHRWLWPNLVYLLRLHGRERVERYGGVDPGKGVDNDFAAVLIRKYDASGQMESDETRQAPLVSAEWHVVDAAAADRQSVVHTAQSDEFTLHLGMSGQVSSGRAGIWLIYADFLGAKPPASWPKEPEYAGGILAFFEARWAKGVEGRPEIGIIPMMPRHATGFDWQRWALRTLASPDSKRTAKLSDRMLPRRSVRESENPVKVEPDDPANGSQPIRSETNRTSSAVGSRR
jgi:hypothetical protein